MKQHTRAARAIAVALIAGMMGGAARGVEYFVAPGGLDSNTGTNWDFPLLTIGAAVAKSDADIVTVSNGTYNIIAQIVVGGPITVRSFGDGVYGGLANASNTVVQRSSGTTRIFAVTDAAAMLDGFTLRNGLGRGDGGWHGNGVYMTNGCTVQNCIIRDNGSSGDSSYLMGGGVRMEGGTLSNCIVRQNANTFGRGGGAGIYARGGLIVDCQVLNNTNNSGWAGGGGIFATNTQIVNCQVIGNTSSADPAYGGYGGGGICAASAATLVRNCLVVNNVATVANAKGGGVYKGTIESCTIAGNSCTGSGTSGGGVYGSVVTDSIVLNNATGSGNNPNYDPTSTFAYSCAVPQPPGVGNVNSAAFADPGAGNYRLLPCPAVNAGTDLPWMADALDLAGANRILGGRVDMGAYERVPGAIECHFAADVTSIKAPSAVAFSATAFGTNVGTIASYTWDFGDGQTTNGAALAVVANTYSAAGLYTVTLTVTNDAGLSAAATNANYIAVWGTNAYVWADSPSPAAPYHTWSNAAQRIADAVSAAPAGTVVVVTNGTYNAPDQIVIGKAITVCGYGNGVYGGLANASNTVVQRSSGTFRIFAVTNAGAVLDGLTIRNGTGRGDSGWNGNGVFMTNGCTVMNCIIKENGIQSGGDTSHLRGGGVHLAGGTLSNCHVVANKLGYNAIGGGIYATGGQIVNCTIVSNSCPGNGGGIYANGASVSIRNCLIASNAVTAAYSGGGVYLGGGSIDSCTVAANSAAGGGGGVYRVAGGITNSIVYFNTVGGAPNNLNTTAGLAYSCSVDAGTTDNGNIMGDPRFVDMVGGDYRLDAAEPRSPCIDRGDSAVVTWTTDLDGQPRIRNRRVDIGAYESTFFRPYGVMIYVR